MADRQPIALSPLHHQHLALGAEMVLREGWQRPVRYTSVEEELDRVSAGVGICDVSPAGKLAIQGDDVDAVMRAGFPGVGRLGVGQITRIETKGDGGAVLARLVGDELLAITEPNQAPSFSEALAQSAGRCAHVVDITSALAGVRIAGPLSHRLLAAVTEMDVSPGGFPDLRCAQGKFADVHGTLLRDDLGALPGYALYFGREYGEYMWEALVEAGGRYGLVPFGTDALARIQPQRAQR